MTTAATSTFEESRDQIIAEALEICGAIGIGDARTANNSKNFDSAAISLNRFVKSLEARGYRLWRYVTRTTTTTQGTATITLGTDVINIDEPAAYIRAGGTARTQIMLMSADDYARLGDQTTQGMTRQIYVARTLTTTTAYLWPVPDATGDTIEYRVQVKGKDFVTGADTPDFFSRWTSALLYGLVVEICPKYGQPGLIEIYKGLLNDELPAVVNDDTERGNMILSPYGQGPYSSGAG